MRHIINIEMNSTKVQIPRRVNELHIHWNPASHLMGNCEELAQPQRKLEKPAVFYFREPKLFNNNRYIHNCTSHRPHKNCT